MLKLGDVAAVIGMTLDSDILVSGVTNISADCVPGDIFCALPGARTHGSKFATQAIAQGAVAVLTDAQGAEDLVDVSVPVLVSAHPRKDMGTVARIVYHDAQAHLITVGITGTNGKTTTSFFVERLLSSHLPTAVIGTTGVRFESEVWPSARTTPESATLHRILSEVYDRGARGLVMEVSSHALELQRVQGMHFDVAVFTNLTQDHLDFHGTMANYFAAKAQLFSESMTKQAVVCVDDDYGRQLLSQLRIPVATYGFAPDADWRVLATDTQPDGTHVRLQGPHSTMDFVVGIPGVFNVLNATAAVVVCDTLGFTPDLNSLTTVHVPGRLQPIGGAKDFNVYVDYAHTPDAVERVLNAVKTSTANRIITVLGCGGDRDSSKRMPMGSIAAHFSDIVIVTDDNPRSEDPQHIRRMILEGTAQGTAQVLEIGDRAAAIAHAIGLAGVGDCVAILGKGHEAGQEIAGVVHPFSDVEVAQRVVNNCDTSE